MLEITPLETFGAFRLQVLFLSELTNHFLFSGAGDLQSHGLREDVHLGLWYYTEVFLWMAGQGMFTLHAFCVRESHYHNDIFDIDMSRVILLFRSTPVLSR